MSDNTIEPDTYMGLSQQYIKDKISDEEFTKRCNRLKRIPINTYVSISEKFMQGEISENEFEDAGELIEDSLIAEEIIKGEQGKK